MNPNSKRLPQGQHLCICADAAFLYIQAHCPAGTFEPAENDAEYAQHEYQIYDPQQEGMNLLKKTQRLLMSDPACKLSASLFEPTGNISPAYLEIDPQQRVLSEFI